MSGLRFIKSHKIIFSVLFVDVIIVAIVIVFSALKNARSAKIDVLITPMSAVVEINGEKYNSGVYALYPGEVSVKIVADGFQEKSYEVELKADQTTRIHEFLMPDEDNMNYYARNEQDYAALKRMSDEEAKRIVEIISIRDKLPIVDYQYGGLNGKSNELVIAEKGECKQVFCLLVRGNTGNERARAVSLIKEKGYNPDDYEIIFEMH